MSHRGRPESQQSTLSESGPRSPLSPLDARAHKLPKTRVENRSGTRSPENCKTQDEYMALLSDLSKEAAMFGNSISCNGWSNTFMPSKKHFPDATRSKVPVGGSGSPVSFSPTSTSNFYDQQLLEARAREWDLKALALNPYRGESPETAGRDGDAEGWDCWNPSADRLDRPRVASTAGSGRKTRASSRAASRIGTRVSRHSGSGYGMSRSATPSLPQIRASY